MTDPEREQLLGSLLGALDEDEQSALDAQLESDAEYRKELALLRRRLEPLAALRINYDPPPGLAERTCRFVAAHLASPASAAKRLRPEVAPPSWVGRMTKLDMVMAATVLVAASLLIFPAVANSRFSARRAACQDNLQELGKALAHYSQTNGGYFPRIPTQGKLATAGIYAPVLFQNNLITDVSRVVCPDSRLVAQRNSFHIPTYSELELAPNSQVVDLRPTLGGSYGYNLGYTRDGSYYPTKNLYRDNFAIMSDSPSDRPDHQSENHGGLGQNVLFENGSVRFLTQSKPEGSNDDIFTNDAGQVAAGLQQNDSVVGASQTAPIIYVNRSKP
ncbi:MAG: hypothetical protein ABSG67_19545 [Thermoguttaceae bacterium]|jgi:hypothetical protein